MSVPADYRILVVEDDPDIQELLVIRVKAQGYQVRAASNGLEAYVILKEWNPHLVLCDVVMPIENGLSFCRRCRTEGIKTPFLFLTAKGQSSDIVQVLDAGADDYIVKPFEPAELKERIAVCLARHNSPSAA